MVPRNAYALLIGIEKYGSPTWALDGPANDAFRCADWLVKCGVPPERVVLLVSPLDGPAKDPFRTWNGQPVRPATRDNITQALTTDLFPVQADLFFLYWGGHGFIGAENDRRLFYSTASTEYRQNLDLNALLEALRSTVYPNLPRQFCLIDACANAVSAEDLRVMPSDRLPFTKLAAGREQVVLMAAAPGQAAKNLAQEQTGQFSREVLTLLESDPGQAWPPDARALTETLEARFKALRAANQSRQTPTYFWFRTDEGSDGRLGSPYYAVHSPASPSKELMTSSNLVDILRRRLSMSELRILTHSLGLEYEDFNQTNKGEFVLDLVHTCEQRRMVDQLWQAALRQRPDLKDETPDLAPSDRVSRDAADGADALKDAPSGLAPDRPASPTTPTPPSNPGAAEAAQPGAGAPPPVRPDPPARLSVRDLTQLRDILLQGQAFQDAGTRQSILDYADDALGKKVSVSVRFGSNLRTDLFAILNQYNLHNRGIAFVIEAVQAFEGDPATLEAVQQFASAHSIAP